MTNMADKLDGLQVEQLDELIAEAKKRKVSLGKIVYDPRKIYCILGVDGETIYKLHSVSFHDEEFAFIDIGTTNRLASGRSSFKSQVNGYRGAIHIFDTQKDFIRWCAEQEGLI